MTRIVLIPSGQTDWREQKRLTGDADLPLNKLGHRQAVADAEAISSLAPKVVRSGSDQAAKQTATLIADHLGVKQKALKELREMDLGHWEGLALEDFRERFPKVYKQWRTDPTSIEPPEGETVHAVAERLEKAIQKIVKEHPAETIVIVLGHIAYAILRCRLQDHSFDNYWDYEEGDQRWHAIEVAPPPVPAKKKKPTSDTPKPTGGMTKEP